MRKKKKVLAELGIASTYWTFVEICFREKKRKSDRSAISH